MPTLQELYLQDLETMRQQQAGLRTAPTADPTPGFGATVNAAGNPLMVGKGVFVNTPINVIKALLQSAANLGQAAVPFDVPGATDEPIEGFSPLKRLAAAGNAALLGLPKQVSARVDETYAERGQPKNDEDRAIAWAKAIGTTALKDVLPGNEIQAIVQGADPATGQPLTSERLGDMLGMGALKIAPFGKLLGKGQMAVTGDLGKPSYLLKKAVSAGEIEARKAARLAGEDLASGAAEIPKTAAERSAAVEAAVAAGKDPPPTWLLTPEQLAHFEVKGLLSTPAIKATLSEVSTSPEFAATVAETSFKSKNRYAGEAIRRGALPDAAVARISKQFDIPLADVPKTMAELIERSATEHSRGLKAYDFMSQIEDEAILGAAKGDKASMALRDTMKSMRDKISGEQPTTVWGKMVWFANKGVERVRRALLVSQLVTATRNAVVQGDTAITAAFEHAVSGTVEAISGKIAGLDRPLGVYYADLAGDWTALVHSLSIKQRMKLDETLKLIPKIRGEVVGSFSHEIQGGVMAEWVKYGRKPKNVDEWITGGTEIATTFTRIQEAEFRKYFFQARLESHMKRQGIENLDSLNTILKQSTLPEDVRFALADSAEYALKQTYSYTPQAGLGKAILDFYQKVPFATALAPPFPRFVMNSIDWQTSRAPTLWFNMFEPKFRQALLDSAENGFKSAEAARTLGRATTGMFMMNAAWVIRNSQYAGPKYYNIVRQHDASGNPIVEDARAFQPFVNYLFLADMLKSTSEGKPLNITGNEMVDAVVGIRRLSEEPIFALPEMIRSLNSTDPLVVERALKTPVGQYFASFFVPLRTVTDLYGGFSKDEEASILRDTQDQELIGPIESNIPGVASRLPARINVWTGQPQTSGNPLLRQASGINRQPYTKLQSLANSIPDVQIGNLIGNHGSQEADALVSQNIGRMLTADVGGHPLGDVLARAIQDNSPDVVKQRELLNSVFAELRAAAVSDAEQRNPKAFLRRELQNIPISQREEIQKILVQKGVL